MISYIKGKKLNKYRKLDRLVHPETIQSITFQLPSFKLINSLLFNTKKPKN